MSTVHVYAYPWQRMTNFVDATGSVWHYHPRKLFRCHECGDLRWAKRLKIQAYYDAWNIRCADGCYGEREKAA